MRRDTPLITWLILVNDRTAAERFPFRRKFYRFSYSRATEEEIQAVLRLCTPRHRESLIAAPTAVGETCETLELGGGHGTSALSRDNLRVD